MKNRQFTRKPACRLINQKNKVIFIVGPTAAGKSSVAVSLAQRINAEIISCDSMQVYKGMDIISAIPSFAMRKKVKHHLTAVISPTIEYNAARYRLEALRIMRKIIKRGKVALFVGGTGLYASVLIDGIFKADCKDPQARNRLYHEAEKKGSSYLHAQLQKVDPDAAVKIHPNDTRRIVRALEIFYSCGKPISQVQKERKGLADKYEVKIFCLNMARDRLYRRIDARVEEMFKEGLALQVKRLLKLKLSKTSFFAIGIRELKGYFSGNYGLDEAMRLVKKNTRNYAKRQLTWFRKDKRIEWINLTEKETPGRAANKILRSLSRC